MEDCHEGGRGFSSSSCVFRCVIFLLAVRIHYDFSYLILKQQTSQFHIHNLATLRVEENCSTTTASNSKFSTERS